MSQNFFANLIASFINFLIKPLLRLRYRVEVQGIEEIEKQCTLSKGILFLPNHPAEIDPVILMSFLWNKFHPRPLVLDTYYHLPGVHFLMKLVSALPLPTTNDFVSRWKQKRVEKFCDLVCNEVQKGSNFLIYPAGKLKMGPYEKIGGASLVHSILQKVPDVQIVMLRTTGLWGSIFSKAYTENSPDFGKTLWQSFKIILKNGVFFAPRRKVVIELKAAREDFPRLDSRIKCNQYLENWYNEPWLKDGEPLCRVSYLFWKKDMFVPYKRVRNVIGNIEIPEKIRHEVLSKLSDITKRPVEQIVPELLLSQDLGMDSLDMMQVFLFLEQRYDIAGLESGKLQTVQDVLASTVAKKDELERPIRVKSFRVPKEKKRPKVMGPLGSTIQESFLKSVCRMPGRVACMDVISGALSYRKLFAAILLLSRKIETLPGKYVGILLPSSVAAYMTILAVLFAKKIPVMMNWTAGIRSLNHAKDLLKLETVISSMRFLERLKTEELGEIENNFVFLEDLKIDFSFAQKIKAFLMTFFPYCYLYRRLGLGFCKAEDPAVILFTSGTESLPKAVPLSHKNILSNERSAVASITFVENELFYGVLPPFHSFGFSVTGLLPLLTGLRVFYSPDPTDHRTIVEEVRLFGITMFCSAPSFIRAVFQSAKPLDLKSVRLFVSGAEKAPDELFQYVKEIGSVLIEGYGITECSPIVTLNGFNTPPRGVGKPLPGVDLCIIDQETRLPLPQKMEGEVCISGPNVFSGYLGSDKHPFIEINDKTWYRAGDRGYLDEEGYLILSGRLSRFVKIGGEMVSLPGVEADIEKIAGQKNWLPKDRKEIILALGAKERTSEKTELVLFTTFQVNKEELNAALREIGHSNLVKISDIRVISEIPLTGTGKVQYRALDDMVNS